MRSLLQRCALVLGAAVGLLGTRPATANAQKALVYCPVSIDATGCNAIVTALTGPAYPLGVDRGYDGTDGTVDLKTVDVFSYTVFIVPSLADDATSQPYAKLRDPEVVEHLKAALIGRIAMWSGTPDQGAANRAMKDALIQNLAGWAGGAFATAKGPGLVALLDASASVVARYDWVRAIAPLPVTSDPLLLIYSNVRALNQRATTILTSASGAIAYSNMATFGFQVPNGAAGVSLDAVGQTGTSQGGQVVLLTMEAGNSSGATVKTDQDDYAPGTTVVITGAGWQANEVVELTLHMDPLRDADTELTATADAGGTFTNTEFAPAAYDVGVRFVLTAVGQSSGRRAQTTFTDGNKVSFSTTAAGAEISSFGTVAANACFAAFLQERQGSNLDNAGPGGRTASLSSTAAGATFFAGSTCSGSAVTSITIPAGQQAVAFSFTLATAGLQTIGANAGLTGSNNASATITVTPPAAANTTTTASNATATYGDASVNLSATVTSTSTVNTGTVTFTVKQGATTIGSATTSGTVSGGNASVTYALPAGTAAATYTLEAVYNPGAGFNGSSDNTHTLTIDKKSVTITPTAGQFKFFGDADPALTFTNDAGLAAGAFSGALARASGENAGLYAINLGTLSAGANYTLSLAAGTVNFEIKPKAVTITPNAGQFKIFAAADPTLTFMNDGGLAAGAFTGALGRVAGENVGLYAINLGTLSAGPNYTLSLAAAVVNFEIKPKPVIITPTAGQFKFFGDADPALTFTNDGGLAAGAFTGALARASGENVGFYAITLGTLSAGSNYTLSLAAGTFNFEIKSKSITITPTSGQFKIFGDPDPTLTFTPTPALQAGDSFSGALGRAAGENVGLYAINLGTLSAGTNYTLTLAAGVVNFEIQPKPITITPTTGQFKTFSAADPTLTYTPSPSLLGSDDFSGALGRAAGENVGLYAINLGTLSAGTNYTLTLAAGTVNFEIKPKPISIAPTAGQFKIFGDPDPTLTFTPTPALQPGDGFTGALARTSGENVGLYPINLGTLSAGSNYTLTLAAGTVNFEIKPKPISIAPTAGQSKTYGDADPTLTFTPTPALLGSDTFAGALGRAAGESVGFYAINLGTLSAGPNYTLSLAAGVVNFEIKPKLLTASIVPNGKQYDGNATATVASCSVATKVGTDDVGCQATGALFDDPNAGSRTVTANVALIGTAAGNYTLGAQTTASAPATITKAPSTTTVTGGSFVYDALPHAATAVVTGVGVGITQTVTFTYSGSCSSAPTTVPEGTSCTAKADYAGDVNHDPSYGTANITITKATPTIVWSNPADIIWPAALTSTQLNAVVNGVNAASSPLPGTKTYTPSAGAVLTPGTGKPLKVDFVPTDVANYANASKTVYINVLDKTPPIVTNSLANPNPVPLNMPVTVTASVSDAATGGSGISSACFKVDNGGCVPMSATGGTSFGQVSVNVTGSIAGYPSAGVHSICVYGTDSAGNEGTEMIAEEQYCVLLAVYDPSAGFVTGGGWINSPTGAYAANPSLSGKATFGFVSKYKKGQSAPEGNTEFQFHAAGMNFKSTSYEWLVVAGAKAQYKGSGTINGSGDFFFMLTAIDGDLKTKGTPDTFRMKIWNRETLEVIYDNLMGVADTADPTGTPATLGGGSINIQAK